MPEVAASQLGGGREIVIFIEKSQSLNSSRALIVIFKKSDRVDFRAYEFTVIGQKSHALKSYVLHNDICDFSHTCFVWVTYLRLGYFGNAVASFGLLSLTNGICVRALKSAT